jgi:hypothetical protein
MAEHQDIAPVVYKELAEYPGYRFGSDGSVWGYRKIKKGRRLVGIVSPTGYRLFSMVDTRGMTISKAGHVLTLTAFRGTRPPDLQACHNDGNRLNNCIDNLRWDTRRANRADMHLHGTAQVGEKNPFARLKDMDIPVIRRRLNLGHTQLAIANEFNVSESTIALIGKRKTWRHVTC